jgi:hypothetical protein
MMKRTLTSFFFVGVVLAAGIATLAAPQVRPGEPTKPSVWVENRGLNEAVPTTVEGMSESAPPLRVEVVGTPSLSLPSSVVIQTRAVRQQWEHRLLTIQPGQDIGAMVAKVEAESWEAVGFQATSQGLTAVLLKRPR